MSEVPSRPFVLSLRIELEDQRRRVRTRMNVRTL